MAHHHPESLSSRGGFTRLFVARSSPGFTGKISPLSIEYLSFIPLGR